MSGILVRLVRLELQGPVVLSPSSNQLITESGFSGRWFTVWSLGNLERRPQANVTATTEQITYGHEMKYIRSYWLNSIQMSTIGKSIEYTTGGTLQDLVHVELMVIIMYKFPLLTFELALTAVFNIFMGRRDNYKNDFYNQLQWTFDRKDRKFSGERKGSLFLI